MATDPQRSFHVMVGQRIKAARKALGMTQQDLSQQIGFKDRQILSNIESGLRKLSSSELLTLMKALKKDLEYFTDPLRLVGEGAFCWRAEAEAGVLDAFEEKEKPGLPLTAPWGRGWGSQSARWCLRSRSHRGALTRRPRR
jgi:transcriptional regulator with XRE-family HTH domain